MQVLLGFIFYLYYFGCEKSHKKWALIAQNEKQIEITKKHNILNSQHSTNQQKTEIKTIIIKR